MSTFAIKVVIEKDGEGYHAYCPSLKGLHVGGQTKSEAIKNVNDAVVLYVESMLKNGEDIPDDTPRLKRTTMECDYTIDDHRVVVACG